MRDREIRVGVIGAGKIGSYHIRNLAQRISNTRVVAVMDVDQANADAIIAECHGSKSFTSADTLITNPDVDAVIITAPDQTHAELTLACLKANKPVLCEKPLATNVEDAERVFQAEIVTGRRLVQVGFMREFDPPHRKVKHAIAEGEIGQPLLFRGTHYNTSFGYDRHIDEVIVNSAIHDIHSARWLMDEEISSVYVQSVASDVSKTNTCRLLVIHLTFRNGSLGLIEVNSDSGYGYEVNVEITGELGQIRTTTLSNPIVRRSGNRRQSIETSWLARFDAAYLSEMQSWSQAVATGDFGGPTAWDGYVSLVVANSCKRSFQTGQPETVPIVNRPEFYSYQR